MGSIDRRHRGIIDRLELGGTLFERLIRDPEGWANPEALSDSPTLIRYAMDVRQALVLEGWRPPEPNDR
jgi:hypothetical protein